MLRFSEPGIEAKMHALFEGQADKGDPIMDPPEDIVDDDERWAFVIGETEVKLRHGSKMVETLPYVMQHLPKYKGKGQDRRLRKPRIFVVYVKRRKRIEITIETLTLRSGFGNWLLWARSQPNHSWEHADHSQGGGFPRP